MYQIKSNITFIILANSKEYSINPNK